MLLLILILRIGNYCCAFHQIFIQYTSKKNAHQMNDERFKKTGGDLLSRFRSTIGARGLNFCVRNGNR